MPLAALSLLGATLFWSGNFVVGRAAVATMAPIDLVFVRWLIAVIPLLLIAHFTEKPDWRAVLRAWPWVIALACAGMLGYNLLLYTSLQFTTSFVAALINAFNPALIALAAAMLLGQRLTARSIVGILIALVGVLVVLSKGSFATLVSTGFGAGQLFMIGAIIVWTIYTMLGRFAPPLPPITSTAAQAVVSVLIAGPISLFGGGPSIPTDGGVWGAVLFISIFPSVCSYLLWNKALTVIPAGQAGVFLNLITVFTAILTIILGQPSHPAQFIGGAIVIAGVVVTNWQAFAGRRRPA